MRKETVGNFVLNIAAGPRYGGTLCGVNPRYDEIDGFPCYASIADIPETPDCVVLAVNDTRVEQALAAAAADLDALAEAIARLSVLAATLSGPIAEMDVNPIVAHEAGAVAVDVLIVPRLEGEKP